MEGSVPEQLARFSAVALLGPRQVGQPCSALAWGSIAAMLFHGGAPRGSLPPVPGVAAVGLAELAVQLGGQPRLAHHRAGLASPQLAILNRSVSLLNALTHCSQDPVVQQPDRGHLRTSRTG